MVTNWHQTAHYIWQQGDQIAAIQQLIKALNEHATEQPTAYVIQLAYYFYTIKDYPSACVAFEKAHTAEPDNFEITRNYAVCLSRSRQYQ